MKIKITRRDYDGNKAKGVAIARHVSTILREAGFPKSAPYQAYARQDPGYLTFESGNGSREVPTASVCWANERFSRKYKEEQLFDAIEADGRFDVDRKRGHITRKVQA